ncbi:MAG: hypothetical protein ACJAS1_000858 [Oleiphilaceae bacterium]|jgi:hypothetical protein
MIKTIYILTILFTVNANDKPIETVFPGLTEESCVRMGASMEKSFMESAGIQNQDELKGLELFFDASEMSAKWSCRKMTEDEIKANERKLTEIRV